MSAPDGLQGHPWYRVLWDSLAMPALAPALLPKCPLCRAPWEHLACTCLSSSHSTRHPLHGAAWDLPAHTPCWFHLPHQGNTCAKHPRAPWFIPSPTSAVLPGQHLCRELSGLPPCIHFNLRCLPLYGEPQGHPSLCPFQLWPFYQGSSGTEYLGTPRSHSSSPQTKVTRHSLHGWQPL